MLGTDTASPNDIFKDPDHWAGAPSSTERFSTVWSGLQHLLDVHMYGFSSLQSYDQNGLIHGDINIRRQ